MSSTDRQNRLLVAEDWKRIYQTYQTADFQSYDFENLKRVMIDYIRENYPEDFNDYIQSSEYIALIDLIAYLGQNLSFRIDLNARENFLELAERRESILRLARLLSYNPTRNVSASGLLKITSVRTTEVTYDSNNLSLQNQNIIWNDPSNSNWYEQFIKVINKSFRSTEQFGNPVKKSNIEDITTSKYKINSINVGELPITTFSKTIDGASVNFELVPVDFQSTIYEQTPLPDDRFSILYREDGIGPASNNTGFFAMFKQGGIDYGDFEVTNPSSNQLVTIDAVNVNNDDVWLYKLNDEGVPTELWTKVESIEGNNIIYNDVSKNIRTIYSVLTRVNDRITIIFSDGVFGDLPVGNFRLYFRTSRNARYNITPREMLGIGVDFEYTSQSGKLETLSLVLELQYTVDNAEQSEDNESIRKLAPMSYYTQNRLITAEDYQVGPLLSSNEIIKTKSVNRISSGISRYFDLIDATGKYSRTNLYGTDGIIYQEFYNEKIQFQFETFTEIEQFLFNVVDPVCKKQAVKNFYYSNVTPIPYVDQGIRWELTTSATNLYTGRLINENSVYQIIGKATTSILQFIRPNTHIKFEAPAGYHFTPNLDLLEGPADYKGATTYLWRKVVNTVTDGTILDDNGNGAMWFADKLPSGSLLSEIRPFLSKNISDAVKTEIVNLMFNYKTFGLRYDRISDTWAIINEENLNTLDAWSLGKSGDTTGQKLDTSWLLLFTTNLVNYTLEYRAARYIFESQKQIAFYFDKSDKIFDSKTGKIVRDKISVLSINTKPFTDIEKSVNNFTTNFDWAISDSYRDALGYVTSKKVEIDFFDSDDDGISDNESLFLDIVAPNILPLQKYVFQKKTLSLNGVEVFNYISAEELGVIVIENSVSVGPMSQYEDNQLLYFAAEDYFQIVNKSASILSITNDYKAFKGRDKLQFRYEHAADEDNRIDPSISNIIDTYILTRQYDTEFRDYLAGTITEMPLPLSSDQIYISYGAAIEKIKSLTDEIIYHPAKYRILFGDKAHPSLQAIFKVIKNAELELNDNDIKSQIITLIGQYFSLNNWDFGQTFYMEELSAYLIKEMAPNIVSVLLVPLQANQVFGSLYEIKCEDDELLISGATVSNIEIIDEITALRLQAGGNVTTSTNQTTGIQSGIINY